MFSIPNTSDRIPKVLAAARSGGVLGIIACVLFFVSASLLFIRQAGLHTDEALFAAPLFREWKLFSIRVFNWDVPLMNLPYLGALKTWLYAPIFRITAPTTTVIRIPAIAAGTATIVLFWRLLVSVESRRSAFIGSLLLVSDACYLLTTVFDWGPVVIQRLLLVSVMILGIRWVQRGGSRSLVAAALCCGLGVWDKAVFVWTLMGLMAGFTVLCWRRWRAVTYKHGLLAVTAFCLGCAPLIYYNLANPEFPTLSKSPVHLGVPSWQEFGYKVKVFSETLDGSALFGYLPDEDNAENPRSAQTFGEKLTFRIRDFVGDHRTTPMPWLVLACVVLLPWTVRSAAGRLIMASITACAVALTGMVLAGGGGAAHHTSLLWPLPHMFVALTMSAVICRWPAGKILVPCVLAFAVAENVLVTNQHLYQFIRNGATLIWSDAIDSLANDDLVLSASQIILPDWGITDSLCVLLKNTPPSRTIDLQRVRENSSSEARRAFLFYASDRQAVWILRSDPGSPSGDSSPYGLSIIRELGFAVHVERTKRDSHGRVIFNLARVRPSNSALAEPGLFE